MDCSKAHAKRKLTRDHNLLTLDEFREGLASGAAVPAAAAARVVHCSDHPGRSELHELTLFCRTCDK